MNYRAEVSPHPVEAIIFDMDGLLLDSEQIYARVWRDAVAAHGAELTHEHFLSLLGRGRKGALKRIGELFGVAIDLTALNATLEQLETRYFNEHAIPTKPGVDEIFAWITARQFKRALATSTVRERALPRLTRAGIVGHFDALVTGDEVTNGKPAPDIFLLAADRLAVAPAECVVLEDSEQGIRAAVAAGMTAIMIPDLSHPSDEVRALATAVLDSLASVPAAIESRWKLD